MSDDLGTVTIQSEGWSDDLRCYTGSRVLHADPRCLISSELLTMIRNGEQRQLSPLTLDGDLLTIEDSHGTRLVYRVHPEPYRRDWPDGGYLMEQVEG